MVHYYNPCSNMFPSGATAIHHRLHPAVTTSSPNFNFVSTTLSPGDQNCYPLYTNNSNSSPSGGQTVATLSSGPQLGLTSSSPSSQYSPEIGAPLPPMSTEVLQPPPPPPLGGPHHNSWYSMVPQPGGCGGRGSMVAASPFEEWPTPNTGSPISASSPCISGSPVSSLPPCAFATAMTMPSSYGQPIQMGAYHGIHRADPYSEHLHHIPHHYHSHPYQNAGLIAQMNSEATPVHPSPDSGLTASSDGAESPNGHQNDTNGGLTTTPNGTVIKSENNLNRPQPARSPYEWMKKPSYQNQINPTKTRTKDKYRVVYSDHQRLELEKEFHYSRYITIRRKSELASLLSLSERQVKIWFQNRRAKERKQAKKRDEVVRKDHHNNQILF
ncbi:unnamed protein product [Medioppia subpectinata]|uniref:Homeobox domain-containing protein n=1 Tax=Medioppia subpectinata TaxID=1979941 RepID=A0A7R9KK82_9ACAR|nr:unnamed protein product [Medioppia subpectinata]CAG2103726.1 unnamed protein product [Medioppia subpectinata]